MFTLHQAESRPALVVVEDDGSVGFVGLVIQNAVSTLLRHWLVYTKNLRRIFEAYFDQESQGVVEDRHSLCSARTLNGQETTMQTQFKVPCFSLNPVISMQTMGRKAASDSVRECVSADLGPALSPPALCAAQHSSLC
jgi:hypothetical protein